MKYLPKVLLKSSYLFALFGLMATMGFAGLYLYLGPNLPNVDSIREIRLQTPMTIYSSDGELIAEFGDKRRIPITLDEVPQQFIHALIATEDQRFYEHSGVDFIGVMRAFVNLVTTQTKSQGASTITQLVARNVYLHRQRTFTRKFREMFLAWKIESEISKNEILELFLNKAHFSHRAYGIGAAAQVYYGKALRDLTLPQLAVLAGIPKGESSYNPISSPEKALRRRNHVLGRMLAEQYIDETTYEEATSQPITSKKHGAEISVSAHYVAEMVRREVIEKFGREEAYSSGYQIYTTLDSTLQRTARQALRQGLKEYDERHGYRGPEFHREDYSEQTEEQRLAYLNSLPASEELLAGLVTSVQDQQAEVLAQDGQTYLLEWESLAWAAPFVDSSKKGRAPKTAADILKPGDVVRVITLNEQTAKLSQIPEVSGGFIAVSPSNGAVKALVGGFDFNLNQFNMVTQARRQPGSNIKPFIYSAALEKEFTAASVLNDAPFVEEDITAEDYWRPKNDSGNYKGLTRLRDALKLSNNSISVRLINAIAPSFAENYLKGIGFPDEHMQPYASLALGSASFTPLEVVTGYASFANGGYRVKPYFIERIESSQQDIVFAAEPITVCPECEELLEQQVGQTTAQNAEGRLLNASYSTPTNGKPALSEVTEETGEANESVDVLANTIPFNPDKLLEPSPLLPIDQDKIAPRVIEARNAYIVNDMMKDVIHKGTAWRTLNNSKSPLLRRSDIGGKTGTTNDARDAWFSGFNGDYAATAWVGFADYSVSLGRREYGGKAALPIWQKFMEIALRGKPSNSMNEPPGIVTARIDAATGKLANTNTERAILEMFRTENVPEKTPEDEVIDVFEQDPSGIF